MKGGTQAGGIVLRHGAVMVRGDSRVCLRGTSGPEEVPLCFARGYTAAARLPGLGAGEMRSEEAATSSLAVTRECFTAAADGRLAVRLRLRNTGSQAVGVDLLTPFWGGPEGVALGAQPAAEWVLMRQPRYKNDMPATTALGAGSPGVHDAVRGTLETGGWGGAAAGAEDTLPRTYVSAELTTLYGRDGCLTLGFMPLDQQLVRCRVTLEETRVRLATIELDCLCDGQLLPAGACLDSQWVVLDADPDPYAAIARYAASLQTVIGGRPAPRGGIPARPTVWCSWYYYGDAYNQEEAEANLEVANRRDLPFDVIQIDECWDQRFGDWTPNADWPDLAGYASRVRAAGYVPGLWSCGFLVEPRARLGCRHPEWLLRRRDGSRVRFDMAGMRNYVLDPTHPEVGLWLEDVYRRLTVEYGYQYHKIDFTRAVVYDPEAVFHDPACNRAQAYRQGIEAIRRGIGPDAYLNICGGLYGALLGLADAQRTGSDVKSVWPPPPAGEEEEGYGPFTIKQNTLRYWWNELWDNDPDALMVRRREASYRDQTLALGLMSDVEALTSALNQYLGGGLVCTTENLTEVEDDRLLLLRHCSPSVGTAAVPRDAFAGRRFPAVFDTSVTPRADGLQSWHTISVVNWSGTVRDFELVLDERLLGASRATDGLVVSAFLGGWTQQRRWGDTVVVERVPAHGCEVIKVQQPSATEPLLLCTDGHFSMGATEVAAWCPEPEGLILAVTWPWPVQLRLELAPPRGRAFRDRAVDQPQVVTVAGPCHDRSIRLSYA